MFEQAIAWIEGLKSGVLGYVIDNWLWLAIAVVLFGFLLDQALYCVRFRPWKRWMHNLRVCRRFLEKLFKCRLPWPPDVRTSLEGETDPFDPDAPLVVHEGWATLPAQPTNVAVEVRNAPPKPAAPVSKPIAPPPRPATPPRLQPSPVKPLPPPEKPLPPPVRPQDEAFHAFRPPNYKPPIQRPAPKPDEPLTRR